MTRALAHSRTNPAGPAAAGRSAARPAAIALRLIVAPVAAIAAALAGLLFAVLLPICGIATICEGIALTSWKFVRDTLTQAARSHARRV